MRGDFFLEKKEKKLQETNIHCPIFCDVLALSKIPPFSSESNSSAHDLAPYTLT